MRRCLILLLLLIVPLICRGDGWFYGGAAAPAGISDSFGGTLGNWTQDSNAWEISTGTAHCTSNDYSYMHYSATATANASQYAKVQITTDGTSSKKGIVLRYGSTGGYAYVVQHNSDSDYTAAYSVNTSTWALTGIETVSVEPISSGDWIGAEVTGTGTSTVISFWHWVSDPGERASWGAADGSATDNPTYEANDGLYVGLESNNTNNALDNFSAGSN